MMNRILLTIFIIFTAGQVYAQKGGGFGIEAGFGAPFLSQTGLSYQFNDRFGISVTQNTLDLTIDSAGLELTMPEVLLTFHPFEGSYFIGLGVGQETLEVTAGEVGVNFVSAEVDAMTMVVKTGWKWGLSDGGFWFGVDVSYIMPTSPESTITAPGVPTTDQAYIDAQDAVDQFGETAYTNITFAKLGYIF